MILAELSKDPDHKGDPWPYGLEPNRVALEALNQYLVDQGLLAEKVTLEDMFIPIVLSNE